MKTYCFLAFAIKGGKPYTCPVRMHGHGDLEEAVEAADLSVAVQHGANAYAMLYFEGLHSLEELCGMQVPEYDEHTPGCGPGWQMFILDRAAAIAALDCYPEEEGGEQHAK